MVSVCLPSDALLQHLPSYLGFSYLGCGESLPGCSSKAQPLLLTLDEGYLLTATPPDLERGFLTCIQVSQEAGQVVWYSHLLQNFPQFIVIHAVLGCNFKNDRMISAHFQGKPFNIRVIQDYSLTSNAKEAEVEWFYEDLHDFLELTPKKRCPFHYRGLECKSRKSRNTWSNRQIWPWNTE